ncbi:acyltransferase [Bordetella sp. FB-8]|uniref:acyltransferase family protein n=1 Tax=Bordetella sp. FB-8 TaxID=1159870 RepID=UPI0003A90595|nr:acyltransferase [Bordetella sp. FB-8]
MNNNSKLTLIDLPVAPIRRSDGIDLLRGVLAIWVCLSHAQGWVIYLGHPSQFLNATAGFLTTLFQSNGQTHPAVVGFIVLSGYCIHLGGFRRSRGKLRTYAVRRFFRIWPVYILACLVGAIAFLASEKVNATAASALSGTDRISLACMATKLSGVSAFIPTLHQCSFEGNAPLTTVMVEIWLYVVYAIAVFLFFKRGYGNAFLCAVGGMFVLGSILVSNHPDLAGWWNNGSLPSFLAYWWIGALFVSERVSTIARRFWLVLAIVWVVIAVSFLTKHLHAFGITQVQQIVLAVLFGILITAIIKAAEEGKVSSIGAVIGRAGYSLYAFHAPVLYLGLIAGLSWHFAVPLALAAGFVLHHIFEHPIDRFGKRLASKNPPSAIHPTSASSASSGLR